MTGWRQLVSDKEKKKMQLKDQLSRPQSTEALTGEAQRPDRGEGSQVDDLNAELIIADIHM